MVGKVREAIITHVTITGGVIPLDKNSYMELVLLAHRFRKLLVKAVKMYAKGIDKNTIVKETTKELNLGYADTIYKLAKLVVEGARHNNSNPLKVKIRKLFIASRGFKSNKGNRNIRLLSTSGFRVYLVDPSYTSKIEEILGKELGLDKHTASSYALIVKTLQPKVFKMLKSYYSF